MSSGLYDKMAHVPGAGSQLVSYALRCMTVAFLAAGVLASNCLTVSACKTIDFAGAPGCDRSCSESVLHSPCMTVQFLDPDVLY